MIYYVEDDDNIRGLTLYALHQQGIEAEGFSCDSEFKAAVARRVPDEEYERLLDFADEIGVEDYFWQEGGAAEESFIPPFDLTGV